MTDNPGDPDGPIVFFDGDCGFCNRSVKFILEHERTPILKFAPLQGPTARAALATSTLPDDIGKRTVVLKEGSQFLVRSQAVLRIMQLMGGPWPAFAAVARIVPRPLADMLYRLVAWLRGYVRVDNNCQIPTPEQRPRFLQ